MRSKETFNVIVSEIENKIVNWNNPDEPMGAKMHQWVYVNLR